MSDSSPELGMCTHCGHLNQRNWVLCDACGQRLPWAPPAPQTVPLSELTDEELALRFAPPRQHRPSFLLSPVGRALLGAIVTVIAFLWVFVLGR